MSIIIYQGIQTSLEPRLIEPLVFKHKLAFPIPHSSLHAEKEIENKNINNDGSFSFIKSLTTPQNNFEKFYVNHVPTRSSNTLSKQSLDMCTESLGSETGTDEYSSLSLTRERDQSVLFPRPKGFIVKKLRSCNFPPPLSSSDSVQVTRHLEDGRLVIKAITKTSPNNYFKTERNNGHLKLSLMKEKIYTNDHDEQKGDFSVDHAYVEGIEKRNENVGGESEKRKNMWCKELDKNGKSGMSSWGSFLVATT